MEGRLSCKLSNDAAAFAKIRHLEDQVKETLEKVDQLEDKVLENTDVLDDHIEEVSELLDTNKVTANLVDTETLDAVTVISDKVNTLDITATAIDVSVADVESLKADALQGITVSVEEVIATTGKFTETQTGTANNETTNTTELKVNGIANITGTTTVDGDIIFTKDTGLSKLEGNYLDIEASNITIENKNGDDRTALLVKDVDSLVEFEGKLKVHNYAEMENLTVNKEANLSDANLDNPTFDNIADTQRVSTRCLDIDDNGKLVRLNIGEASDAVVTALVARDENDLERVNISADGAHFNEPVELNGETKIVSETVTNSNIANATIETATITDANITTAEVETLTATDVTATNATVETATTTTLTATDAALDNITTNLLNNKKFYENEWYDCIAESSEDFIDFVNNTTLKYPKVMLLSDVDALNVDMQNAVIYVDVYCPKGTTYTATVYLSKYSENDFHFHGVNVTIITDEFAANRMALYFKGLAFDDCIVTLNMTDYVDNIQDTSAKSLNVFGLTNSEFNFTPAAPSTCSWTIAFEGTVSAHSSNSTINVKKVEGQSTENVKFKYSESCTCTAYNITSDFYLYYNSTSLNTFIDKDNNLKKIDASTLKAIYNDVEEFDSIAFNKQNLKNMVRFAPTGLRKRILYIGDGEPLVLDTADFASNLSYDGGDSDVYFAKSHNVTISDSTTDASSLNAFLNCVTWHGAIINCAVSRAYIHMNSLITALNIDGSDLYITDDATVSEAAFYLEDMLNSRCFIDGSVNLTMSLEKCNKAKFYIRNLSGVIRTVFIRETYDSIIDVNTSLTITSGTLLQYGPGSNMFQCGSSNKELVNFILQPLQ